MIPINDRDERPIIPHAFRASNNRSIARFVLKVSNNKMGACRKVIVRVNLVGLSGANVMRFAKIATARDKSTETPTTGSM